MDQMLISMLQKMPGLTPEQMQALSTNAINLLTSLDSRLRRIEDALNIGDIKTIEDKTNVRSDIES